MSISDPNGILSRPGFDIFDHEQRPVVFAYPKAGMRGDQETAAAYLTLGETYDLDYVCVSSWHTDIYLIQFPNVGFNSVNFCEAGDYEND